MLEILLVVASILYLLEYLVFVFLGLPKVYRWTGSAPMAYPLVTVVVAARNEQANIENCLRRLLAQEYPIDRLQIVCVNDESEDSTFEIVQRIAESSNGRLLALSTYVEPSHAHGKARAIAQGIDASNGEIILLTDADCLPGPTWVRSVIEHFQPGVDVFGGFTVVRADNLLGACQQLDWVHLQALASCSLAFGSGTGVIGNNFGFRRSAYDAVGGYRSVHFTVTEDFALFRAMHTKGFRTVYPCSQDASNLTLQCDSLMSVMRQKQRWARGGTESSAHGYSLMVVAFLMLTAFCIAPFVSVTAWVIVWSIKWMCDVLLMYPIMRRLGISRQIRYFVHFEFYFIIQVLVIPFLLMNPKLEWKGRVYRMNDAVADTVGNNDNTVDSIDRMSPPATHDVSDSRFQ